MEGERYKMTKKEIGIDSVLIDLELSTKKAKAIIEDLTQDYFDKGAVGSGDAWEIAGMYYEEAGLMARIANDYLYESEKLLKEIREVLDEEATI